MPEASIVEAFRALAGAREPELFEGALLVSALVDPGEDLEAARRAVAALAARVGAKAAAGAAPHTALCDVLFSEEGFRGDQESYDQPSNSSIARVLARKRGLPITLSILAIEVGRLAGLRLTGVGLPGHFVVGGPDLPDGMYLDPFDGGALYDAGGLARKLSSTFGQPVAVSPEILRPDPPRAILSRVLLNLRRSYERRDRWEEALEALACAEGLEPDDASLARERGLLLLKCGRPEEALPVLEGYAASAQGEDAETMERLIEAVRKRGSAAADAPGPRRIFTLEEARTLLPRVQELTSEAVEQFARLPGDLEEARQEIVRVWAEKLQSLGAEIKGLWLVDFDSGAGYYCWKYPEPALNHFHSYEEGFAGRLPLT
jgi:regulator of sirC expression with transglutaminase-like and TPR domain